MMLEAFKKLKIEHVTETSDLQMQRKLVPGVLGMQNNAFFGDWTRART
jgi:hypothetical protein